MFEINYMGDKKRILKNIENEQGSLGTQSRIYDCTTGFFTRILTNDNKSFSFAETGIGWNGILQDEYFFTDILDGDEYEKMLLTYEIKKQIDGLRDLSIKDINSIIQNGFLHFLSKRNTEICTKIGFSTLLRAEQIIMKFEKEGKLGYNEVLKEITNLLEQENLNEEDRKILEQLKLVYKNDMFKLQREGDKVIKEEQDRINNFLQSITEKQDMSSEFYYQKINTELFRNTFYIEKKLMYFSMITDAQLQIELLNEVPKSEKYKFIGKIKSIDGIVTALNNLDDEKSKRKTLNNIAKQFKGNNEGMLKILSKIDFDVTIPQNMMTFKLNNLNALNLDFLINIQKHAINYSKMKFKINEKESDSPKIEYSFSEISAIIAKVEELTADIPEDMDEANKFYIIYSRITGMITYDHKCLRNQDKAKNEYHQLLRRNRGQAKEIYDDSMKRIRKNPAGLYGGLVNGKAICAGYALILHEALKYIGIKSQYVIGFIPGEDGHAWNQVQIDGKWYNVDPTWDSEEIQVCGKYKYMLLNDEDFNKSHREFSYKRTKTEHKCKSRFDYSKIHGLSPNQIESAERG